MRSSFTERLLLLASMTRISRQNIGLRHIGSIFEQNKPASDAHRRPRLSAPQAHDAKMAPAAGAQTRAAIASGTFDNEYGVTPMIISLYVRVFRRDPFIAYLTIAL